MESLIALYPVEFEVDVFCDGVDLVEYELVVAYGTARLVESFGVPGCASKDEGVAAEFTNCCHAGVTAEGKDGLDCFCV